MFEIDQFERSHNVLLTDKNLRVVLAQVKLFVIPLLSTASTTNPCVDEHFVLKDLSFYEVAHSADIKARPVHLDAREKKYQEGTLHQALSSTS